MKGLDIEIKYGCGHEKPGSALEYGNITNKTIFDVRQSAYYSQYNYICTYLSSIINQCCIFINKHPTTTCLDL